MKGLLICLAIAACPVPLGAQPDATVEAERARIAVERTQANARLTTQEAACYKTFAVNDCLTVRIFAQMVSKSQGEVYSE